jgi:hypothetical protein
VVVLDRLVLVARLKPDPYERAEELASAEARIGPDVADLRYSVFLSPSEVVFVAEGKDVEHRMREWFRMAVALVHRRLEELDFAASKP